jgi:hypothetical protein
LYEIANITPAHGFRVLPKSPSVSLSFKRPQNDVPMFRRSGLSIARGNASVDVKAEAALITAANDMDGFAQAMERFILRR